jgi:putative acetyltransferase
MLEPVIIRPYARQDAPVLMDIFNRAVRSLASRDYDAAQIEAWMGRTSDAAAFQARREAKPTFIAEIGGVIAGFSDLEPDGHIDMLFVEPAFARRGVGRALLKHIEAEARAAALPRLYAEASITAKPAFVSEGYTVITRQDVFIGDVALTNYRIEKVLRAAEDLS